MMLIGRWSPSSRSFRVRVLGPNRKRTTTVHAPREAQVHQAVEPSRLDLSNGSIALVDE